MKNHAIKLLHGHYHWLIINICCKWTTLIGESDILVHFDLSMVLNCKLKDVLRYVIIIIGKATLLLE